MITWLTVWVLTVTMYSTYESGYAETYQLTYSSQKICEQQRKNHQGDSRITKCNFQQIPVVK